MDILARNRSGWSLLEVKNIEEWEMGIQKGIVAMVSVLKELQIADDIF